MRARMGGEYEELQGGRGKQIRRFLSKVFARRLAAGSRSMSFRLHESKCRAILKVFRVTLTRCRSGWAPEVYLMWAKMHPAHRFYSLLSQRMGDFESLQI